MTNTHTQAICAAPLPLKALSQQIEHWLVERNLRGMQQVQPHLRPGYVLRAARLFNLPTGSTVLIGTGFPVLNTFETDGPVGAIALYRCAQHLGLNPVILCGDPLFSVLQPHYNCYALNVNQYQHLAQVAEQALATLQPALVLAIERPGFSANGRYMNMRGEDISARCASFDFFLEQARCPTLAIGDGGNEIGMGNVVAALDQLNIIPSITECDELVIADVSNWAAWGIIAMLSLLRGENLLAQADLYTILQFLVANGCIDGVTRQATLTEDGLPYEAGEALIQRLHTLVAQTLSPTN
ncbi:glutamate cyclase domain-containing protein [Alishewanella tabrizica]|uniref:D-glutamate cyclase-like C-terminal domain-containing protein n=1 Tax=Alishewanella tabrizica TaxID=671278 RepID=A0ABQ2WTJ6_9ALTE|nr:glutamate cyclase domain-containing protein [Alishewanella tabrizica]GGW69603.1 hypothetical protein GCM10008111_26970 [Alishewanella tabrizica]